jgi:hydrogenase maturation protease
VKYLIGVGNYSACDDGIGLRIVENISERGLEKGFRAVDLSSNLLNLFSYLDESTEHVLIVDSARMGLAPGEFRFFGLGEIMTRKELAGFSTHEGDLLKVLELAKAMNYPIPPITFLGIEPETVKNEFGLSETLKRRLPEYVAAAIRHLRIDKTPRPKSARRPRPWRP